MQVRKAGERGHFDHGWLKTWHSFSFAGYYDPRWMGYRSLRVLNDDIVAPRAGFPMHPHRDMEIISYVVEGSIEHRDNMGHESTLRRGEIQVMSAGSGIVHSEFNPSPDEELRLLQIWIEPNEQGITPRYGQRSYDASVTGQWQLLAAPAGTSPPALVELHAGACLYRANLEAGQQLELRIAERRAGWLQMIQGSGRVDGVTLERGDGVALDGGSDLLLAANTQLEALLFDLR